MREKTEILVNFLTACSTVCLIVISAIATYFSNRASVTQQVEYPYNIGYLFRLLAVVQFQHMILIIIYYRKNKNLRKAVAEQIYTFWKMLISRSSN